MIGDLHNYASLLPEVALSKVNLPGPEADVCASELQSDAGQDRQHLTSHSHLKPKLRPVIASCQVVVKWPRLAQNRPACGRPVAFATPWTQSAVARLHAAMFAGFNA